MSLRHRKKSNDDAAEEAAQDDEPKVHSPPSTPGLVGRISSAAIGVLLLPLTALGSLLDPKKGEKKQTRVGWNEGIAILRITWDIIRPKWHWFAAAWARQDSGEDLYD